MACLLVSSTPRKKRRVPWATRFAATTPVPHDAFFSRARRVPRAARSARWRCRGRPGGGAADAAGDLGAAVGAEGGRGQALRGAGGGGGEGGGPKWGEGGGWRRGRALREGKGRGEGGLGRGGANHAEGCANTWLVQKDALNKRLS